MEKKFTFYARTAAYTVLTFGVLVFNSLTAKTYAQTCSSANRHILRKFWYRVGLATNPDNVGLTSSATGPWSAKALTVL